jgi:hypothetical protein
MRMAVAETVYPMATGLRKAVVADTGEEILISCKPSSISRCICFVIQMYSVS